MDAMCLLCAVAILRPLHVRGHLILTKILEEGTSSILILQMGKLNLLQVI